MVGVIVYTLPPLILSKLFGIAPVADTVQPELACPQLGVYLVNNYKLKEVPRLYVYETKG